MSGEWRGGRCEKQGEKHLAGRLGGRRGRRAERLVERLGELERADDVGDAGGSQLGQRDRQGI